MGIKAIWNKGGIWVLFLFLIIVASGCMRFRTSTKKVMKRFDAKNIKAEVLHEQIDKNNVRYIIVNEGKKELPLLVFIHGAPGSSDNYFQFMDDPELVSKCRMISIDRPGYGFSDFGKSLTSIESQAHIVNHITEKHAHGQKVVLIGHSFGGPIAAKSAVLAPGTIQGLILLAPAIDPDNEKIFKVAYLGKNPPFRWITPRSLKVAADEKFTHVNELQLMAKDWQKLSIPVIHMHGDKDRLVPYINLEFSKKMIDPSLLQPISLEGEDHFLPWTQKELIRQTILEQIDPDPSFLSQKP